MDLRAQAARLPKVLTLDLVVSVFILARQDETDSNQITENQSHSEAMKSQRHHGIVHIAEVAEQSGFLFLVI